jgi:hypothetical protein
VALADILEAFRLPENTQRMREARENAANDMLKTMQVVFPVATHIQMGILPKYGFPGDGDGWYSDIERKHNLLGGTL